MKTPTPRAGPPVVGAANADATATDVRPPFAVDVMRDRGTLAHRAEDGGIENVYRLRPTNRTEVEQRYRIGAEGMPGLAVVQGAEAGANGRNVHAASPLLVPR